MKVERGRAVTVLDFQKSGKGKCERLLIYRQRMIVDEFGVENRPKMGGRTSFFIHLGDPRKNKVLEQRYGKDDWGMLLR